MSDLASLLSQLKIIQDQIKVIKDQNQTTCTICCDLKDDKMCQACNQSVCTPCYAKLGNCPFCKNPDFGQLDDLQVQAGFIDHFYQNDDDYDQADIEVITPDQDDVELYDHGDQGDDVRDADRAIVQIYTHQRAIQQRRLRAHQQARHQLILDRLTPRQTSQPARWQVRQQVQMGGHHQLVSDHSVFSDDQQINMWGPICATTDNLSGRQFDVQSTHIVVRQTINTLMVSIDNIKNFRIPLHKPFQQVRVYQNIKLIYFNTDTQDSYLLIDTPTCVGMYKYYGDVLRIKNK